MRMALAATRTLLVVMAALLALAALADQAAQDDLVAGGLIPATEPWPGPEKKLYSQFNEELIIRDFFRDRKNGFFLDVGCSKPIENSTTYYLEKHLGWSGIGIDALPEYAQVYRKKRPRTKFFNYIVTDHSGIIEEFYRVMRDPELSSTIKDRELLGSKLPAETIRVPTITLDELLEENGVTRVDFLSLDIEGGAPKALAGFDIERYQPQLICIEAFGLEEFIQKYFAEHHYQRLDKYLKHDFVNWYYTPGSGDAQSR